MLPPGYYILKNPNVSRIHVYAVSGEYDHVMHIEPTHPSPHWSKSAEKEFLARFRGGCEGWTLHKVRDEKLDEFLVQYGISAITRGEWEMV